jgi:hypothetical protein
MNAACRGDAVAVRHAQIPAVLTLAEPKLPAEELDALAQADQSEGAAVVAFT